MLNASSHRLQGRIAHCPRSGGEAPALSDEEAQRYLDGYADLKYHFKADLVVEDVMTV